MVWPFKKNRGQIIDLTYLAKRGLLKIPQQEEYKDLTASQVSTSSSSNSSSDSDSSLGFLGAIAENAEPVSQHPKSPGLSANRVEDIEYKLEIVSKRVNAMLDRLDLVEKKLSRDLRQAG